MFVWAYVATGVESMNYAYKKTVHTRDGDETFWYHTDTATGRTCTDEYQENENKSDTTIVFYE